jgi:hypothetical protein
MKRPNNLNVAKLTFISILLIALSSGCFFAGKNWNYWFPDVVENPLPPVTPKPPAGSEGGDKVVPPANDEHYTDFEYDGKTYRVEKSLLTEAGSKYNANKRFYRFLNNAWEMKEGTADAKWKPATPSSDIPLILTKWDAKFRAEEVKNKGDLAQTNPLPPTPPVTPPTTPPVTSPPKDPKPPKTPPTEIPKVTPPTKKTLTPPERAAIYNKIEEDVKAGKCDRDCILKRCIDAQIDAVKVRMLYNLL